MLYMGTVKSTMPPDVRELHIAVMTNDVLSARRLINTGTDVNYPWQSEETPNIKNGSTPLCEAVSLNHRDIVKMLIEAGAFVNKPDNFGCTPLHKASCHGRSEIASILIKAGADVNFCDHKWNTPLHICVRHSVAHNNMDTVRLLIEAGADVDVPDQFGRIPLHYSAIYGLPEFADVLVKANSCLDYPDPDGKTPLHYAAIVIDVCRKKELRYFVHHLNVVKILVLAGCDTLNLASIIFHADIANNLDQTDIDLYSWFHKSWPESLKQLSRSAIRKYCHHIGIYNLRQMPLPLPLPLLEYVSRKLI